jgi:hypothetical protein
MRTLELGLWPRTPHYISSLIKHNGITYFIGLPREIDVTLYLMYLASGWNIENPQQYWIL